MPRLFTGTVELSEAKTPTNNSLFIGTTLRFLFHVSKAEWDINNNIFPEVRIQVSQVSTWHPWQQHEVHLNGHLIGTIAFQSTTPPPIFVFPFQPKLITVDTKPKHEVAQKNVNELIVRLGSGGYGLNDSFDVEWIDIDNLAL